MDMSSLHEFAAFVGIDWADRKHDVCLLPAGATRRESSILLHRPEAIAQWAEVAHALRRTANRGVPGARQGATSLCIAALRVPHPLSDQSDHTGQISPDLPCQWRQGRSERC